MKKVTLFAAMAALVFVSCNKEENLQLEMSNHTITASMETDSPETRTAFDRESGALYRIKGDDIAVLNTNGSFTEYTLSEGEGTANGTFSGTKIGSNSNYALHPYSSHKYENSELTFNLPTSYTYGETEKGNEYGAAPMIAQTDEVDASNFYFEHLGGAFCFTIKNIPANTTYFKFVADEQITGDFPVVTNEETDKFEISLPETQGASESPYAVTINFPTEESATNKKFFIPLPVGKIDGFTISLGTAEGETWSYTSTASNTITRRKLLAMPVVTLNASVDGTVATEISTLDQLKAAFANGGTYTLNSDIDDVNETLVLPANKILTLNLGNYTLTSTVAYNNDSKAIVNNGKLTITSDAEGGIVTETRGVYNEIGSEAILNCNIKSTKSNAVCNYFTSKLTINGGKYESELGDENTGGCAVRMGDESTDNAWTLEINGGTFKAPWAALYLCNNYYGLTPAGSAKINGGTFEGGKSDIGATAVKNITIAKECTLDDIRNLGINPASYACEITGTVMCDLRDGENHYAEIFAENTQEAIASVFTNGGTITLTENATIDETLTVAQGKTVVLNLGNYTLTSTVAYSNDSKAIVNKGKLTITSDAEGGIVTETRGVYNEISSEAVLNCNIKSTKSNAVCNYFTSKLTINGGKYESELGDENTGGCAVRMGDESTDNAWTLEINGGTFKAPWAALYLCNNYYGLTPAGSAKINGGTFEGGKSDIGATAVKNITIAKECTLDDIRNLGSNPASYACEITGTVMCDLSDGENHYTEIFAESDN